MQEIPDRMTLSSPPFHTLFNSSFGMHDTSLYTDEDQTRPWTMNVIMGVALQNQIFTNILSHHSFTYCYFDC
jgi:hypothetical protein